MVTVKKDLHLKCEQCHAEFPLAWILNRTNGAKEFKYKAFCSTGCEKKYFSQVPQGVEAIMKLHSNPLTRWRRMLSAIRDNGGSTACHHHD